MIVEIMVGILVAFAMVMYGIALFIFTKFWIEDGSSYPNEYKFFTLFLWFGFILLVLAMIEEITGVNI